MFDQRSCTHSTTDVTTAPITANTAASTAAPLGVPTEGALSLEALESEVVGLAGHLAAGHCRWLVLLAEFDARDGWAGPGLRSCAHWLSWRVGMNLRTGFEQLRVAHALVALPAVTEAFAAGRISYSKVRAITRVATPATESTLLDIALAGTASHVERVVRHARQATADPAAAASRKLHWRWDDDGGLDVRGRFTAEQGIRLIAAIEALTEPPSPEADGPECTAVGRTSDDRRARSAEHSGCGIADNFDGARSAEHSGGGIAGNFDGARSAEHSGCGIADNFDGARSAEHSRGDHTGTGDSCGCAMQPDRRESSPLAARRADALVTLVVGERTVDTQVVLVVDADAGAGTGSARFQGGPAIPMRTAERVGCNARVRALLGDRRGNPLRLGRTRRLASPAQLAALQIRDQGRCQFPGCDHRRHLEAHHIVHWLRGGRTDIDNLVLICGAHHTLIHECGYRMTGRGTELTFQRPDGRRIDAAGAPTCGDVDSLIAGHTVGPIDDNTLTPTWAGERLDVDLVLATLLSEQLWPAIV